MLPVYIAAARRCLGVTDLITYLFSVKALVKTNMAGVRATLLAHFVRESPGTSRSLTLCATNCKSKRSLWHWTKFNQHSVVTGRELAKTAGKYRPRDRHGPVITQ